MRTAFQSMKQTRAACALKRIDGEWNNPRHRQRRYAVNAIDDIRAEQVQRRERQARIEGINEQILARLTSIEIWQRLAGCAGICRRIQGGAGLPKG